MDVVFVIFSFEFDGVMQYTLLENNVYLEFRSSKMLISTCNHLMRNVIFNFISF